MRTNVVIDDRSMNEAIRLTGIETKKEISEAKRWTGAVIPPDAQENRTSILVFAKAPVPGQVKTRLIPALGAQGAAALAAALLRRTLATVARSGLPGELWRHPHSAHPLLSDCAREFGLVSHAQVGGDLGARMYHAARRGLVHGPVILIGADCPDLTAADLTGASSALAEGNDAVLGPALDGGYYLLGLRRMDPLLFRDIAWGSDGVLAETRARLGALGWRWRELATRRDMDRPEDLRFLPETTGSEQWIEKLERLTGRALKPQKRGPKKRDHGDK